MIEIDGFQISDAVPQRDGSLMTTLVDQNGNVVGTVTRLSDGSAQASVIESTDSGGFDWPGLIGRVTTFLDDVAKSARETGDEATRISRGIKGAVTGAQAGYSAPINWQPLAIAVVAGVVVGSVIAASMNRRRR